MSTISLNGMEFYAHHGCFEEERVIGTRFEVDVDLEADTTIAQHSDNVSDTVNYQSVYNVVKREMAVASHLLEHVADRIAKSLLNEFGTVEEVSVKVSKLNPPLGGVLKSASVTVRSSCCREN